MATRYWLGGAPPVINVWRITVGGTWAGSETADVTINNKTLTLTTGSSNLTTDEIAADIAAMMLGEDTSYHTKNADGTDVGEFAILSNVVALGSGGYIDIYGPTDGRPIGTITVDDSGSTSGTLSVAETTVEQSPYHWSVAANWDSATLPVNSDTVVFDYRAANSCLYDLSQTSLVVARLIIDSSYQHSLGLPAVNNENPSTPFIEHLGCYLTLLTCTSLEIDSVVAGSIKVDTGNNTSQCTVRGTGQSDDSSLPACVIKMNNASSSIHVSGGSVALCPDPDDAGQVALATVGGIIGGSLSIGDTVTVAAVKMDSGVVDSLSAVTTVTMSGGVYSQYDGAVTTLNLNGGQFRWFADESVNAANVTGGLFDASVDGRTKSCAGMVIYSSCTIRDPLGVVDFSSGLDIYCNIEDVTLEMPATKTWTISTIT